MAVFNEILVGRFNRALQKLTGIKGGPPVRQLGSEILPVFPIFWGAENRYLESWNRFGFATQVNASAGNNSLFKIRNPAPGNIVIVVEKLLLMNPTAAAVLVNLNMGGTTQDAPVPENGFAVRLDARTQTVQPASILSQGNGVATNGFTFLQAQLGVNQDYDVIVDENQEITVLQGDALQVFVGANTQLNLSMFWRERFLEDSERA